MKKIFEENNEKQEDIGVVIPANIRFEFYKSREDVKLENKFSVLPIRIPLIKTMEEAYPKIKKVTNKVKNSMSLIYGMYALAFWQSQLFPRWVSKFILLFSSQKFTVAFSNTPGAIKPVYWTNFEGG